MKNMKCRAALLTALSVFLICAAALPAEIFKGFPGKRVPEVLLAQDGVREPDGSALLPGPFMFTQTDGVTLEVYAAKGDNFSVTAYYPVTESSAANTAIEDFIKREAGECERTGGSLDITFKIYEYNRHIMSFVFDVNRIGVEPEYRIQPLVFDLFSGAALELGELLAGGTGSGSLLSQNAGESLEKAGFSKTAAEDGFTRFAFDRENIYLYIDTGGASLEVPVALWKLGDDWRIAEYYAAHFRSDPDTDEEGGEYAKAPKPDDTAPEAEVLTASGAADDEFYPLDASNPPDIRFAEIIMDMPPPEILTAPSENKKYIALTFDDGPQRECTTRLLDALNEYGAKATFFVLGHRLGTMTDIVQRMYQEGHSIGNHSYNHKQLDSLPAAQLEYQIAETNKLIEEITGTAVTLLRPPFGSKNTKVVNSALEKGMSIITWDIDPKDWKYFSADGIADHIIERAKDGSIIILHDIYPTTVDAAIIVLKTLTQQDFVFVTVDELINMNSGLVPGIVYNNGKSSTK